MMRPFQTTALVIVFLITGVPTAAPARSPNINDFKADFLRLCDEHAKLVDQQAKTTKQGRQFYKDSYVVRSLCVAYDMTGKQEYLDVCRRWSNRMLDDQRRMIPAGAYNMNYGRMPGENKGNWYVADAATIAMGVLATAVRCDDPAEKARYVDSVKEFMKLVMDRWVGPTGGVANGYWPKSDKEWWLTTGVFGSLAFLLYDETGDESYLKVGLETIDWLNTKDLLTVDVHYPPKENKPTVMMYALEAYSAAFAHLEPGSERFKAAIKQWTVAIDWMTRNRLGRSGIGYTLQWGSKAGGLPFHMYVYAEHVPGSKRIVHAADEELRYIGRLLQSLPPSPGRDQLAAFALMSYAEKVSPGTLYRASAKQARTD
ncbi:MAG: hypothetical protein JW719_06275 [Pirellulales bacterium]|nr:hypothetical protein [Pirellulales bacterium]